MKTPFFLRPSAAPTLALIAALAATGPALAADSAPKSGNDVPPVLQQAISGGQLTLDKTFATDAPGITGYVLEQNGQHEIVYGDHGYLLMGRLISPEGKNLSAQYASKYLPKPDVAKVVSQLKSDSHLIHQGPAKAPELYVFVDPNCIYCHHFYERAEPLVKAGKLQVSWVLVGFLKPSSKGRAAAILSADSPMAMLAKNEKGFNDDSEEGGIKPQKSPTKALSQAIDQHYKQMAAAGGNGTPTVLYRDNKGDWQAQVGIPPKGWLKKYANGNLKSS